MKTWTKNQIKNHTEAAKRLGFIKDEVKNFIHSNILQNVRISESEVLDFIKRRYKAHGLVNDSKREFAICAFGKNTKEVHHFAFPTKSPKLKPESLILLDIWARLSEKDAPYADMTWMFYYGKCIPQEIQKTWKVLVEARDSAIKYIKQHTSIPISAEHRKTKKTLLPRGLAIDRVSHDIIGNAGFGRGIKHTVGHSLGFISPHGDLPGINWREYSPILKNVGYTIEPGIYLKDFGMRTEIDFYVNKKMEVIVTTPTQKEIELIF